jgi:hypothetical protein
MYDNVNERSAFKHSKRWSIMTCKVPLRATFITPYCWCILCKWLVTLNYFNQSDNKKLSEPQTLMNQLFTTSMSTIWPSKVNQSQQKKTFLIFYLEANA